MDPTWMHDGETHASAHSTRIDEDVGTSTNAEAGPSRPAAMATSPRRGKRTKAPKPFVSADHRPEPGDYDERFRVVIITSGSVASVKLPLIVGALCKVCIVTKSD